ncbi:MAG TPA: hypothetical protein DD426_06845 [Clostridiaceae bacterium]|nr:hypothetical protein [Clostridiaceae bacterium]
MGFERGLIENPENTAYYISKICDITFERIKALKDLGCSGYISSETYCSADILSPQCYQNCLLQNKIGQSCRENSPLLQQ